MKRKGEFASVEETPYIVMSPKGCSNLKKLSEIKRLRALLIRWEAYRNKRPNVTQCRNCHRTNECSVQKTELNRCSNCSGAHEATDPSCPNRADFIQMRQQASEPKSPVGKADKKWISLRRRERIRTRNRRITLDLQEALALAHKEGRREGALQLS